MICDESIRQWLWGIFVYAVNLMHDDVTNYSRHMFKKHVKTCVSVDEISLAKEQLTHRAPSGSEFHFRQKVSCNAWQLFLSGLPTALYYYIYI